MTDALPTFEGDEQSYSVGGLNTAPSVNCGRGWRGGSSVSDDVVYVGLSVPKAPIRGASMNTLSSVLKSPELFPLRVDFDRNVATFVRMSADTYRDSVFLGFRVRSVEKNTYAIRLDDLRLAVRSAPATNSRVHFILNTAYCCSTLLSRYFEIIPGCFVLKEPMLLAQLALSNDRSSVRWRDLFDLCIRLLRRTYCPGDLVVIKPHEACNRIGAELLAHDPQATITFLMTPLRPFLLSVLKLKFRRQWAHKRLYTALEDVVTWEPLARVAHQSLTDAEAAAYVWLANCFLYKQLSTGPHSSRVLLVNGERLANAPEAVLPAVAAACGLRLEVDQISQLSHHPTASSYSKGLSRHFDAASRRQELAELNASLGAEADSGIEWAVSHWISDMPKEFNQNGLGNASLSGQELP